MTKRKTASEFIEEARKIHGDKYDYSKVNYKNTHEKVTIVCPKHGEFKQAPNSHLHGQGCPKCKYEKFSLDQRSTVEEFIPKAIKIHGGKYDYSKVVYINELTSILITCPIHGVFEQTPKSHLRGHGCPHCHPRNKPYTTEEFIQVASKIHHNKYCYDKTVYVSSHQQCIITCPIHGDFAQQPCDHLQGHGCPKCSQSKLEREIEIMLKENNINYIPQCKFEWLKHKQRQTLDFFLPNYNIAIECQGRQHFQPIDALGGLKEHSLVLERDKTKHQLCQEHGIPILYYCSPQDTPSQYLSDIYSNKEELLKRILEYGDKQ